MTRSDDLGSPIYVKPAPMCCTGIGAVHLIPRSARVKVSRSCFGSKSRSALTHKYYVETFTRSRVLFIGSAGWLLPPRLLTIASRANDRTSIALHAGSFLAN